MTLTTYDEEVCRKIEPNVSTTAERFEVLKQMRDAGIPTVVWLTQFCYLSMIRKKTSLAFWICVLKQRYMALFVLEWV